MAEDGGSAESSAEAGSDEPQSTAPPTASAVDPAFAPVRDDLGSDWPAGFETAELSDAASPPPSPGPQARLEASETLDSEGGADTGPVLQERRQAPRRRADVASSAAPEAQAAPDPLTAPVFPDRRRAPRRRTDAARTGAPAPPWAPKPAPAAADTPPRPTTPHDLPPLTAVTPAPPPPAEEPPRYAEPEPAALTPEPAVESPAAVEPPRRVAPPPPPVPLPPPQPPRRDRERRIPRPTLAFARDAGLVLLALVTIYLGYLALTTTGR